MWRIESIEHSGAVVSPTGHVHMPFNVRLSDGHASRVIMVALPAAPSELGDEARVRDGLATLLREGWEPQDIVLQP